MKRIMHWMFAAILICGTSVFTSCDDNSDNPVTPIDNLAEKIIGKWMVSDIDGQAALTNEKEVITFVSSTLAYVSKSAVRARETDGNTSQATGTRRGTRGWKNYKECEVKIEGNTVTLTMSGRNGSTTSTVYQISSISGSEFTCVVTRPNSKESTAEPVAKTCRYERVDDNYKQDILGKWRGHITSDMGSEFDDGEDHQWEYLDDDTFCYYIQDEDGNWVVNPGQDESDYFVDGSLLCTRWKFDGEERYYHEWWEIESIKGGVMKWKALRAREDGTTYVATFAMLRVKED